MKNTNLILLYVASVVVLCCNAKADDWLNFKANNKTIAANNSSKSSYVIAESVDAKKITMQAEMPGCYKSKIVLPDGKRYDVITAPGESEMPVGQPDIPVFAQWVLVPNGSEIKLEINKD